MSAYFGSTGRSGVAVANDATKSNAVLTRFPAVRAVLWMRDAIGEPFILGWRSYVPEATFRPRLTSSLVTSSDSNIDAIQLAAGIIGGAVDFEVRAITSIDKTCQFPVLAASATNGSHHDVQPPRHDEQLPVVATVSFASDTAAVGHPTAGLRMLRLDCHVRIPAATLRVRRLALPPQLAETPLSQALRAGPMRALGTDVPGCQAGPVTLDAARRAVLLAPMDPSTLTTPVVGFWVRLSTAGTPEQGPLPRLHGLPTWAEATVRHPCFRAACLWTDSPSFKDRVRMPGADNCQLAVLLPPVDSLSHGEAPEPVVVEVEHTWPRATGSETVVDTARRTELASSIAYSGLGPHVQLHADGWVEVTGNLSCGFAPGPDIGWVPVAAGLVTDVGRAAVLGDGTIAWSMLPGVPLQGTVAYGAGPASAANTCRPSTAGATVSKGTTGTGTLRPGSAQVAGQTSTQVGAGSAMPSIQRPLSTSTTAVGSRIPVPRHSPASPRKHPAERRADMTNDGGQVLQDSIAGAGASLTVSSASEEHGEPLHPAQATALLASWKRLNTDAADARMRAIEASIAGHRAVQAVEQQQEAEQSHTGHDQHQPEGPGPGLSRAVAATITAELQQLTDSLRAGSIGAVSRSPGTSGSPYSSVITGMRGSGGWPGSAGATVTTSASPSAMPHTFTDRMRSLASPAPPSISSMRIRLDGMTAALAAEDSRRSSRRASLAQEHARMQLEGSRTGLVDTPPLFDTEGQRLLAHARGQGMPLATAGPGVFTTALQSSLGRTHTPGGLEPVAATASHSPVPFSPLVAMRSASRLPPASASKAPVDDASRAGGIAVGASRAHTATLTGSPGPSPYTALAGLTAT